MNLKYLTVGEINSNCYIISENKRAFVIDPGAEGEKIYNYLSEHNLELDFIINTHGHFDHIGANNFLKDQFDAEIMAHPRANLKFSDPEKNLSLRFFNRRITSPALNKELHDGDELKFNDLSLKILHTPGHSEDGISIYIREEALLFSGDCIFASGYGRTDLYDSNFSQLKKSISDKLLTLPESTTFYSGHGPKSTLKEFKNRIWPTIN